MRHPIRTSLICVITGITSFLMGCSDSSETALQTSSIVQSTAHSHTNMVQQLLGGNADAEIDVAISCVTSRLSEADFDAKALCEKIDEIEDDDTRRRYFRRLLDMAYSIRFEDYGDVQSVDLEDRQKVLGRLAFAYSGLERLSMAAWTCLWTRKVSQREQFTPLFMYVEKMKAESERRHVQDGLYLGGLAVIERTYNINLKIGNGSSEEFAWVREKFESLAGRPLRTERQINEDNRKR